MKAKIACDIDNTLYSFEYAAREAFIALADEHGDKALFKGAYNPWQEWRSMTDVCGEDTCWEVIKRVHSPAVITKQRPYPEAQEVLWDLVDHGYELRYISNRSPDVWQATEDWLEYHDFPEAELVCNLNDKIPQVSDCQYIIDDRPKTLVQFVHDFTWRLSRGNIQPRLGFGMSFPFNQALTDIPRIYLAPTWSGIRYYLTDKGVL